MANSLSRRTSFFAIPALSVCVLSLSLPAQAAPKKKAYLINEGGARRTYEVSTTGDAVYPVGETRLGFRKRLLTTKLRVQLKPGADAASVAATVGGRVESQPEFAAGYVILAIQDKDEVLDAAERLRTNPEVISAEPLLAKMREKRMVVRDPLFSHEWHLQNTGQNGGTPGIDVNAVSAWDLATGSGVTIGLLDDGVQHTHPDLQPNLDTALEHNWNDGNPDSASAEASNGDFHGTSCAGIAAAASNSIGVRGMAYDAKLVAFRLIAGPVTDADEADAFSRENDILQIKSNSWGPADDGQTVEGPGPLAKAALESGVTGGRNGKGTIYVWANGNGRGERDNSNNDGYANSIQVVAVGAVSDRGKEASYSEPGANMLVSAPSSSRHRQGTTTTDLLGRDGYNWPGEHGELSDPDYTQHFGGTSSAAPLVSGVIALMLERNPNLGWRDVQEILVRTASKVSPDDADWVQNGAGFHFNHKYGAGLVNAAEAVALSGTWNNLGPQVSITAEDPQIDLEIPDANPAGLTRQFTVNGNVRVEHVVLTANIEHPRRGDLEVTLTSPTGVVSRLVERSFSRGHDYNNWSFSTVHDWGEGAAGTWTVQVRDLRSGAVGRLNSLKLQVFGGTADKLVLPTGAALVSDANANQAIDPGETVSMRIGLQNLGTQPTTDLVAAIVDSQNVVGLSGSQHYGVIPADGTAVSGTFQFVASGSCGEIHKVLLHLQDGALDLGTVETYFTIGLLTTSTFAETNTITIPSFGRASAYPSHLQVQGLNGTINELRVRIDGFSHEYPRDVHMMLVGPDGKRAVFMSGAGGFTPASNVNLFFSADSSFGLSDWNILTSGTFHDTYGSSRIKAFPLPAPGLHGCGTLEQFRGSDPNGEWKLFIFDSTPYGGGEVNSWSLEIETVACPLGS